MANALNKDFIVKNGLVVQAVGSSQSTSTTTGAIVTPGGIGIGGNANIAGTLQVGQSNFSAYDANTWYVSDGANASDTANTGHTVFSAFKTIKKALSVATFGDTVFIDPGTYTEIFPLTVPEGVSVRGSGIREVLVQPTAGTQNNDAFLLGGDSTISDFTVGNFFKPGYAFKFKPGTKINRRSPYIERFSVITVGSTITTADPYGYAAGDAGGGAYLDASVLDAGSLEPSMLMNEATFIVPNATGLYMTNGARSELINGFFYFANKAIEAVAGTTGFAGAGKTKIRLGGITGTFTAGDTLHYYDSTGTQIVSATISSVDSDYIYFNSPVYGFQTAADLSTSTQVVYSTGASPSTATSILLADYHQFGAEIRSIGSAAVFGNYGVIANGTGTDIKLIAFNVSHIGSLGDLSDDTSKIIQAHEIVQQNNGKIYFQTVDQSGDFRVGNQFLINQRTGNVNFGTATINLASLPTLDVTDGIYHTYVTPTSITVGDLTFSGGQVAGTTGNLTFDAGGGNITLADSTYVQGTLTATNVIKSLSGANAVSTNTGAIQSQGGIGVAKDIFVGGNINVVGVATATNLSVTNATISSLTATLSNVTGQQTVASSLITTLTATNFTSPSATISNLTLTTGSVTTLTVSSNSNTNSTTTGALVVAGGVGIARDLYIGGNTYLQGNLFVDGDSFNVSSTNLLIADKTLTLASTASSALLATNAGLYIGSGTTYASLYYDGAGSWISGNSILPSGTRNLGSNLVPWNNLFANAVFDSSNRVLSSVTPTAGLGIAITDLASGGPAASFVVTNTGVLSIIAGTDTRISSATGNVTISNTSTLQSVTGRGATTDQNIRLTAGTASNSQTTGTLVVTGGVGVSGSIYAGNIYSNGAAVWTTATLTDNLQLTNGAGYLTSSTLGLFGVSSINAGTGIAVSASTGAVTVTNIGVVSLQGSAYIAVNTSTGTVTVVNLGVQTITAGTDTRVSSNTGTVTIWDASTLQSVTSRGATSNQAISITANNLSASTNSGQSLLVSGGVGALAVYAQNVFDNANRVLTSVTPVAGNAIGISAVSTTGPNTTFTVNNEGVTRAVGTTYLAVSTSTGSVTFTNLGVQTLTAGTDTAVSRSTGTVVFWTTSTLQSVTDRGAITTNSIRFSSIAVSTGTSTGALTVAGGVGIAGDVFIGGSVNIVGTLVAATVIGSISTASHIFGGALGSIPYQTASGRTDFIGTGTVGSLLQMGANTATFVTTSSITVKQSIYAVTATNLYGGNLYATAGTFTDIVQLTNTTPSVATNTGALQVAGGVGVGGSVVAAQVYDNGNRVITQVTPTGRTGIGISNLVATGPTVSFDVTNLGVTATIGTTYLGVSATTGSVTFTNLGVQTLSGSTYLGVSAATGTITLTNLGVQTLTAGTDTVVSNSTGTITVWNTSTLQSITNRGASTNVPISIQATTASNTSTAGALNVAGGVGIVGNLNVGSNLQVWGKTTFVDAVTFNGTVTYVLSTNSVYTDNLLDLHVISTATGAKWTFDDGKDIGFRFNYFNRTLNTGTTAALVLANDTQWLEWYNTGTEIGNIFSSTSYGSFKLGNIALVGATNATSTTTGALTVVGGVGIGQDLYVGGTAYVQGSQVVTAASLGQYGVSQIVAGPYIAVSPTGGTGTVTIGNLGVQYITTGSGIAVTTSTGTVNIASIDTLQLVTDRGFTTSNRINITNNVYSGNTNSSQALLVAGGVGALAVYATNLFDGGNRVVTSIQPNAGSGIQVTGLTTAASVVSFTISNTGVLQAIGTTYLGVSAASGNVTFTNLGVQTLTAGTDTYVSSNTGTITIWSTATLQSITNRGNSTTNAIYITNATSATTTTNGALVVSGGVGVLGDIFARNIYTNGQIVGGASSTSSNIAGGTAGAIPYQTAPGFTNFIGIGPQGYVLYSNGSTATWTGSGALLAGTALTATNIAGGLAGWIPIQMANSQTSFITSGTVGQLLQMGTNTATWISTSSLYVQNAQLSIYAANITGGSSGTLVYQSSPNTTAFVAQSTAGNVLVSGGTGAPIYQNTLTLSGGTQSTSPQTGALVVTGGAGFGGNVWVGGTLFATVQGSINTATNLYQGATGSIPYQESPGITKYIGIGGAGNLLQVAANTATWVSTATLRVGYSDSSAATSNLAGGSTGQIPYQAATGVTNFIAAGGIGSILQMGLTTATFINTTSIYVGNAVYAITATNIAGGSAGGLLWQRASGITDYIGIGQPGQILQVSVGNTATWQNTGSTVIGSSINISGGTAGQIPYQESAGVTKFINPGITGSILQMGASGTSTFVSTSSISDGGAVTAYTATFARHLAGVIPGGGALHYQITDNTSGFLSTGTAGNVLVSQPGAPNWQNTLTLSGTTQATSTNTGALVVGGGVGIGGNLWIGGTLFATVQGSINTATNIQGGQTGDILYQTSPGVTGFLHGVASGNLVQFNGSNPVYVSTSTLAVGAANNAINATNLLNGAQGSIPIQSAAGVTSFIPIGPAGYILQSQSTTATWISTGSLVAGSALYAYNLAVGTGGQIPYNSALSTTNWSNNLTFNGTSLYVGGSVIGYDFRPFSSTAPSTAGLYGSTATGATSIGIATNGTNRIFVGHTGNVGIGNNTSPATALDVNGGAQVSGVLTVTNISSFATNGNLTIAPNGTGGVYFGTNNIAYFQNTTNAVNTTTGAVQIAGGLGVNNDIWAKNIYSNSLDVVANSIMYAIAFG
jgi:hypothetical protein